MSAGNDEAFFETLAAELRRQMPKVRRRLGTEIDRTAIQESTAQAQDSKQIVESLQVHAREAFRQCTTIIVREKEIARKRIKIDQKKYGQARRRKNTPYDQAGSVLTVMLTGYELTKPGLWAAKVLWHSGFRGLFEEGEMDVVHPHSPSDRGKEDVAALMRWGKFERESVDQLEDLMKIAARGGQAQAAFTDAGRGP